MSLREEDLVPGCRFLHPETFLEYADFHEYLVGAAPLPHYINHGIKNAHKRHREKPEARYIDPLEGTGDFSFREYLPLLYRWLTTDWDHGGYPREPYGARIGSPHSYTAPDPRS